MWLKARKELKRGKKGWRILEFKLRSKNELSAEYLNCNMWAYSVTKSLMLVGEFDRSKFVRVGDWLSECKFTRLVQQLKTAKLNYEKIEEELKGLWRGVEKFEF